MPITNMTRGHINFLHGQRAVTIGGEMLNSAVGGVDYVIYPFTIKNWDAPHEQLALTPKERQDVLDAVLSELRAKGTVVEVENGDEPVSALAATPQSVAAGGQCSKTGFWATPARLGSRRYFFHGEVLPEFETNFGQVMWHWDADQDTPESPS